MDITMMVLGGYLLISTVLILFASVESQDEKSLAGAATIDELRTRQIQGLREHALKRKFEDTVTERTDRKKVVKVEELLMRAGLDGWSYGEFMLIKIVISFIGILVSWLFLSTPVITIMSGVTLYILPSQLIQTIASRRISRMEVDIGTFIQLTIERYKVHGDFQRAIKQSASDFEGREPIYSEIRKTILDFNVGVPTSVAVDNMGKRTGNKFIGQLANYYEIASTIGTESSRDDIIGQAWINFNDDYKMKKQHEQEIDGPKKDAYIIVGALPLLMLFQANVDENYIDFFLNTTIGQLGLGTILTVTLLSIIFINKKIGGPLE